MAQQEKGLEQKKKLTDFKLQRASLAQVLSETLVYICKVCSLFLFLKDIFSFQSSFRSTVTLRKRCRDLPHTSYLHT